MQERPTRRGLVRLMAGLLALPVAAVATVAEAAPPGRYREHEYRRRRRWRRRHRYYR